MSPCYKKFKETSHELWQAEYEKCLEEHESIQQAHEVKTDTYKNSYKEEVSVTARVGLINELKEKSWPKVLQGNDDFVRPTTEPIGISEKMMMFQTCAFLQKLKEEYGVDVDPDVRVSNNLNRCHMHNALLSREKKLFEEEVSNIECALHNLKRQNNEREGLHAYKKCIDGCFGKWNISSSTHIKNDIASCEQVYRMEMGEEDL